MARERKFSTEDLFLATKEILFEHGYEGFTFSFLADRLDISRGALYKYYKNKEELITNYMVFQMEQFLNDLQRIDQCICFESQFGYLLDIIFKHNRIHEILGITGQIPSSLNAKIRANKERLDKQHLDMYKHLEGFVALGRKERKLKPQLADGLILGIIFNSITISNHFGIPQAEWVDSIKEILSRGMFTN